jgi:hypothetical protein
MRKLGEFLKAATADVYEVDATGLPGAPEVLDVDEGTTPDRFVITFRDPQDASANELEELRGQDSAKQLTRLLVGELDFEAAWAVLGQLKVGELMGLLNEVQEFFRNMQALKDQAGKSSGPVG